ncbi:MAG: hypothetical protein NW208_02440 [Bryobacter sp.]|nr:hypothetical protein [Bryobacter sp.]
MAKQITEMSREELQAAAKTLSALVYTVAGIGTVIAAYILYAIVSGQWSPSKVFGSISITTLVVSTLPAIMRLGQIKKRLKELGE